MVHKKTLINNKNIFLCRPLVLFLIPIVATPLPAATSLACQLISSSNAELPSNRTYFFAGSADYALANSRYASWLTCPPVEWADQPDFAAEYDGFCATIVIQSFGSDSEHTLATFSYGWPLRTLSSRAWGMSLRDGTFHWRGKMWHIIPLWKEYVLSMLIISGTMVVFVYVFMFVKNVLRLLRNKCVQCGYPNCSDVCPECGRIVTNSKQ